MKTIQKENTTKKDIQALLPVLIALCLIPLVILTKDYQTEFSKFSWFNNTELNQIDSFEYAKGVLVIIMGAIAAAVIGFSEYGKMQKKKQLLENADLKVVILLAVYLIMVIISSLFSQHTNLAFHGGGYGQWQTMWVLLGYGMLFMYAYLFINSEKRGLLTIKFVMITTGILALMGVLQTSGHNPLSWKWVQNIITSQSNVEGIDFKEGVSNVILSFNNPNYVGPYIALILPVSVAFIFLRAFEEKSKLIAAKIAGALIVIGLVISLIGSSSSAGFISVVAGVVLALVLILSGVFWGKSTETEDQADTDEQPHKKSIKGLIIGLCTVAVLVTAGIFSLRSSYVQNTINKLLEGGNDTRNVASIVNNKADELDITLRNDTHFTLAPKIDANGQFTITAYDDSKKPLSIQPTGEQGIYSLSDQRFSMITLAVNNFNIENQVYSGFKIKDTPNNIYWTFVFKDGKWRYYTPFGKFIRLRKVESFGFKNYQNIANRRGFIWSRTIPLMKDYWFKGIGPNAFIIAFPNDDFVGSKRVGDNASTNLVDKPHNAFLQIFIQTGGLSALAYGGLWILYMISGIRIFWRRKRYRNIDIIGLGLLVGIFSFAVSGITNDTIIGTQVIYWILLGTGYAVNRIIRSEYQQ
ncbi:MAG: O-antigen ligase family protein [Eubacterium sp.]|nr:O-antigen ligase family protein [Eubacterium sp.]